jgi:hypothetical protein
VIVNVCPAATSKAPPGRFWSIVTAPERFGEWTDASFVRSDPPGPAQPGQRIVLGGRALGRYWTFTIEVVKLDPNGRWIDLIARFPFGIDNYEHLTLTETPDGGTVVRFN